VFPPPWSPHEGGSASRPVLLFVAVTIDIAAGGDSSINVQMGSTGTWPAPMTPRGATGSVRGDYGMVGGLEKRGPIG